MHMITIRDVATPPAHGSPAVHHWCGVPRRKILWGCLAAAMTSACRHLPAGRPFRILVRSGWQDVNIGDIAHTPGLLAVLEHEWPDAEVAVWASRGMSDEVVEMLRARFPAVPVARGQLNDPEVQTLAQRADLLIHGSGPSFVAYRDVAEWVERFGRPFGIYGITYSGAEPAVQRLLARADFAYFRDSVSLERALREGVAPARTGWAPDAAFATDVRNETAAGRFLSQHGLRAGEFACCIPRYRYTPYWTIRPGARYDEVRERRNCEMAEADHAPLREAVCRIVRELGMRVLVCPEDMTQIELGREMIVERLPEDVRRKVVWRDRFWRTDEAVSVYERCAGLFGLEMHSPILCIGRGVPAIVGRFEEQTSKGWMWRDIGLGEWLFDVDNPSDRQRYPEAVVQMLADPVGSRRRAAAARDRVWRRFRETIREVRAQAARPSRSAGV